MNEKALDTYLGRPIKYSGEAFGESTHSQTDGFLFKLKEPVPETNWNYVIVDELDQMQDDGEVNGGLFFSADQVGVDKDDVLIVYY